MGSDRFFRNNRGSINLTREEMIEKHKRPYSKLGLDDGAIKAERIRYSWKSFNNRMTYFSRYLHLKYNRTQRNDVLKAVMEKVARKIITERWKMPFPNGLGFLFISEKGNQKYHTEVGDYSKNKLLREVDHGKGDLDLIWDKNGRNFKFQEVFGINKNLAFTRMMNDEVIKRANDPTKREIRGNLR